MNNTDTPPQRLKLDKNRRFIKRMTIFSDKTTQSANVGMRRAYILPTQKGLYYLLTLAVMFIWAVNYALSLGYAMTFLTGVFALIVAVLTVTNVTGITVKATENREYFAGEPAFFRLQLMSNKPDAFVQIRARRNGLFSVPVSTPAQSHVICEVPLDDNSRGRKTLDYVRLSSDYPIGIFFAWTWLHFEAELLVYPQPVGDLPLPFLPEHRGIDEGQADLHGAEDFADLREYQAGDNIRHIVWKKLGTGQVRVKTFQDLAGQECILDFDDESLSQLSVESRLSQLCAWVLAAEKNGTKYALRLPTQRIDFGLGRHHRARCLEALACY